MESRNSALIAKITKINKTLKTKIKIRSTINNNYHTLDSRFLEFPRKMKVGFEKSGVALQCSTKTEKRLLVRYIESFEKPNIYYYKSNFNNQGILACAYLQKWNGLTALITWSVVLLGNGSLVSFTSIFIG